MEKLQTVGRFSEVNMIRAVAPEMSLLDYGDIVNGRTFRRWYRKHEKVVHILAGIAPIWAMKVFGISATFMFGLLPAVTIPVVAGGGSFLLGDGVILLHMLIIGFLTLVVTTFLKFTGRGDLAPLVVFIGGGIILSETIGLFKHIYVAISSFLTM